MRFSLRTFRWLHRRQLTRKRLHGGFLHRRFGDRLLDKALWRPTRESLARAWIIGFPVTMMPFLPFQSLIACGIALFFRANLLLCIALQFLSSPLTAPLQLPACFFVGEVLRGRAPGEVWVEVTTASRHVFTGDALTSLYLGGVVLGAFGGVLGYFAIQGTWKDLPRGAPPPPTPPGARRGGGDLRGAQAAESTGASEFWCSPARRPAGRCGPVPAGRTAKRGHSRPIRVTRSSAGQRGSRHQPRSDHGSSSPKKAQSASHGCGERGNSVQGAPDSRWIDAIGQRVSEPSAAKANIGPQAISQ